MAMRRRYLYVLAGLLAALLGLAVFARMALDAGGVKLALQQTVKRVTGLDLSIGGEARVQLVPWLGVELGDVALKGLEGYPDEEFLRIHRLGVKVGLWQLLDRKLESAGLILEGIDLRLIRDASGRLNIQAVPVEDVRVSKDQVEVTTRKGERVTFRYVIHSTRIKDSRISLEDRASGQRYALEKLEVTTGLVEPGKPFQADLSFDAVGPGARAVVKLGGLVTAQPETLECSFENNKLNVVLTAEGMPFERASFNFSGDLRVNGDKGLFSGKRLAGELRLSGGQRFKQPESASFSGDLELDLGKGTVRAPGLRLAALGLELRQDLQGDALLTAPRWRTELKTNIFDPSALLRRTGLTPPPCRDPNALQRLALELTASWEAGRLDLQPLKIALDGGEFTGAGSVRPGDKLDFELSLKTAALDLDRYLPAKQEEKKGGAPGKDGGQGAGGKSPDLSALKMLRAKLELEIGSLTAHGLKLKDVLAKITARDGLVELTTLRLGLYQGRLNASGALDAREPKPAWRLDADASEVQMQPLFADLKISAPLSGKAALRTALRTRGLSSKELTSELDGKLSFALTKGAIQGFSLSPEHFLNKDRLHEGKNAQAKTAFDSITGSAVLNNGVAVSKDLRAVVPPHSAEGQGQVDLNQMTLNCRINAHFQGLLAIPVTVAGRLESPSVSVDAGGMGKNLLNDAAKNPQKLRDTVNDVIDLFGGKKRK